jgi:hypothetical protein
MKLRTLLIISIFLLFLPQLISANGSDGRCVVRDSYTDLPLQYDPDLGTGYAKINLFASDFTNLRTYVCTEDVFMSLMESYCTINSNPVQWGVAMGATSGSPIIDGSYHNDYHQNGRCVVRDSYTNLPFQLDPDLGTGYAKINVYASDFTNLRTNVCTRTVFESLMESYCTINSNPVQWGVAMGATSGSPIIDGSYHNDYHQFLYRF